MLVASVPWVGALCVGLSRIQDYWHHWEDVLTGLLLGNLVAYTMYRLRYPLPSQGYEPYSLSGGQRQQPGKCTGNLSDEEGGDVLPH